MSAETGVGPSIASGSQACSGNWPDLPQAPSSSSSVIARSAPAGQLADPLEHLGVLQRAQLGPQQEDRDRQADVADPVHQERLLRGRGRGRAVLVEADQQVRREADALPAEVEHHEVVAQDQQQHRGDEQVELREEPPPARVVAHVADRVEVDQRADPGDEQHERQRQRVDPQPEVDVQAADGEPVGTATAPGCAARGPARGCRGRSAGRRRTPRRRWRRRASGPSGPRAARRAAARSAPSAGSANSSQASAGGAGGGSDLGQLGHVGSPPSGERCTKLS